MSTKYNKESTGAQIVADHGAQVKGKTIVVTGASAKGLGAQTAIDLSRGSPSQIFLLARSLPKVQPVIDQISTISPTTTATFIPVLLDDFESIRTTATQISNHTSKVDILINNAGIMATPYKLTKDGIESQFGTNHIGHFYLTLRLFPLLKAAGPSSRVVNVSSEGYKISPFRGRDYNFSNGSTYDMWSGYGQSKTANILFSKGLAKRGVLSFSLHPGVIFSTSLSDDLDHARFADIPEIAKRNTGEDFMKPGESLEGQAKSIEQGVSSTVRAAVDPDLEGENGAFLSDTIVEEVREYARDPNVVEELWTISEEIVGEKFKI